MNKSLVKTFIDLVKIDSPSGEEKNVSDYVLYRLKKNVKYVKKDQYGNIFARIPGKGDPIFLSGHLDTVEPGRNIKPVIKNECLYSSGNTILGADNKAAVACILMLAEKIVKENLSSRTVELIFSRSEEVGNYGAVNFDYGLLTARCGYCFDSSTPVGTIVQASPYYERFDIKITGKEAHATKPKDAINVLTIFKKILDQVNLGQLDEKSLINIGVVNTGQVRNTIPGEISIKGEIRSFDDLLLDRHKQKFLSIVKAAVQKYGAKLMADFVRENPGYVLKSLKEFEYLKKIFTDLNIKSSVINTWGVSDANIFNSKKLLCINLGDGVEFPHTKTERIRVSEIENLLKLMIKLVSL